MPKADGPVDERFFFMRLSTIDIGWLLLSGRFRFESRAGSYWASLESDHISHGA